MQDSRRVVITWVDFHNTLTEEADADFSDFLNIYRGGSMPDYYDWDQCVAIEHHNRLFKSMDVGNYFPAEWHWHHFGTYIHDYYMNQEEDRKATWERSIYLCLYHRLMGRIMYRCRVVEQRPNMQRVRRLKMAIYKRVLRVVEQRYHGDAYETTCLAVKMKLGDEFRKNFDCMIWALRVEKPAEPALSMGYWLRRDEEGKLERLGRRYERDVDKLEEVVSQHLEYFFPSGEVGMNGNDQIA